jgi:predicted transcriptional regulator YdeE
MTERSIQENNKQLFEGKVVENEGFQAVGLKWDDPSDGDIGDLQDKMVERINEVANVINPEEILGVSYNHRDDRGGFTLYLCVKVSEVDYLPEGMTSIAVPPYSCAHILKSKEQPVGEAYDRLHSFMDNNRLLRQNDHDLNIEVYSTSIKCSSKMPFEMAIYIPVSFTKN